MNTGLPLTSRHIKTENSHHLTITDPAVLAAEPQTGPPRLQHRRPPRSNRLPHPNDENLTSVRNNTATIGCPQRVSAAQCPFTPTTTPTCGLNQDRIRREKSERLKPLHPKRSPPPHPTTKNPGTQGSPANLTRRLPDLRLVQD